MLSIIVPVYNGEKYLEKCLSSIFNSDYSDFEAIVVNDHSRDNSLGIAKKFPARIVDLETNKGVAYARNKGAEFAKGDILVFLDCDVVLEKDTLSKFAKAHDNPNIKIYQCQIYHESITPAFSSQLIAIHHNYLLSLMGSSTSYIQTFAFSIDKSVFFEVGGFNTSFKSAGGEEFEIGDIIKQHNYKMFLDQSFHIHHHFQSFLPRFKKLLKRSYLYGRIVLRRNFKLDKGYGTPKDGINALLSVIGILSLCFSLFIRNFVLVFLSTILIETLLNFGLNANIVRKRGIYFLIRSIPIFYLWYFAMGLGIIKAGIIHYLDKIYKFVIKFSFFFSKTQPYVIFLVTNRCNARCKHCFNWRNVQNPEVSKELTLDEIKRMSSGFGRIKYMTFGGGEPTLRDDITDITQVFYNVNNLEMLNFITNGFATDLLVRQVKNILRTCPDLHLTVSFSIDGIKGQHDEIRNMPGGFDRLLESIGEIKRLKTYYPNLRILATTVYSNFNKNNILDIIDYITKELKLEMVLTYIRGRPLDKDAKDVDLGTYIKATETIKKINANNSRRVNIIRAIDNVCFRLTAETKNKKRRLIPCLVGSKLIEIGSDGTIFPCETLDVEFGNIRDYDYDIKKVLRARKATDFLKFLKKSDCFCTWECAMKNNIVYSKSTYPSLLFELMKQSLDTVSKGNSEKF